MFNSGGMGARPELDGLSATAFPSGVHTMPIEATEHTGPIVDLAQGAAAGLRRRRRVPRRARPDHRDRSAAEGHEFDFSAMFDRVRHPAKGRDGGGDGAAGVVRSTTARSCGRKAGSTCRPDAG